MTNSTPTRIWDDTLSRIRELQDTGVIPAQLKSDAARIDYLVDVAVDVLSQQPQTIREWVDAQPVKG